MDAASQGRAGCGCPAVCRLLLGPTTGQRGRASIRARRASAECATRLRLCSRAHTPIQRGRCRHARVTYRCVGSSSNMVGLSPARQARVFATEARGHGQCISFRRTFSVAMLSISRGLGHYPAPARPCLGEHAEFGTTPSAPLICCECAAARTYPIMRVHWSRRIARTFREWWHAASGRATITLAEHGEMLPLRVR